MRRHGIGQGTAALPVQPGKTTFGEHRGPKWRSALRCAMRPPAPARPPRAPASSMPTSAAYPSATQATNAHERSTAAHITARAHTDHCPAHSSGMF